MMKFTVPGMVVPKPRMTQRDKRPPVRPCVARYRDYCDRIRMAATGNPYKGLDPEFVEIVITARIEMPESWDIEKRNEMRGQLHGSVKDWDNIAKAVQDALFGEDKKISIGHTAKIWADESETIVKLYREMAAWNKEMFEFDLVA